MSAAIATFAGCPLAGLLKHIMLMPDLDLLLRVHPDWVLGLIADDVQVLGVGSEDEVMRAGPNAWHFLMRKLTVSVRPPPSALSEP
eukprot:9500212-Pyramimonas_sp.AAC.1